ncbi:MAG: hypothetical protein ABIJ45_09785, partial [Candidatus Zixiibacteriota bacterium]
MTDKTSDIFFNSLKRYYYRLFFVIIMGFMFVIFSAETHFLGDGYAMLSNLSSESGTYYLWTEALVILIVKFIQSPLGTPGYDTAQTAFRIVAVLAGVITIWFYFLIADIISNNSRMRLLAFASLFGSGTLLLFFGYVESYPLLWIGFSGLIYFAISFLKTGRNLILVLLFFTFGALIHLQMLVLSPAIIYLLFSRGRGRLLYDKYKKYFWGLSTLLTAIGVYFFFRKYYSNLYFENIFLPLFKGKPATPSYYIFSFTHFIDIANQLLLLSPLFPLFVVAAIMQKKPILNSSINIFLGITGICSLGFIFVVDPQLSMPRDWDLFSLTGF